MTDVATASVDHDSSKLWRMVWLGIGLTALMLWFISTTHSGGGGRYAWLVTMLGPNGLWWFMAAAGLAFAALTIAALRLALSRDKSAIVADDAGVTLRSLFGTRRFAWDEVADLRLDAVTAAGRHHCALKVIGNNRRNASLSSATVDGGESALEWWVGRAAEIARARGVRRG